MLITAEKMLTKLIFISGLFFVMPLYAQSIIQPMPLYKEAIPEAQLKQYPLLNYNFIDLIKAIPKPLPASLEKFQKIFNNQLKITEKDQSFITYTAGPFRTIDGVVIKIAGVRIKSEIKNKVKSFGIELNQKQCINAKILKKEFNFLLPDLLSSHPISNAPIAFYAPDEWGEFGIYATMDNPDCITDIGARSFSNRKEKKEWISYVREQAPYAKKRALEGK